MESKTINKSFCFQCFQRLNWQEVSENEIDVGEFCELIGIDLELGDNLRAPFCHLCHSFARGIILKRQLIKATEVELYKELNWTRKCMSATDNDLILCNEFRREMESDMSYSFIVDLRKEILEKCEEMEELIKPVSKNNEILESSSNLVEQQQQPTLKQCLPDSSVPENSELGDSDTFVDYIYSVAPGSNESMEPQPSNDEYCSFVLNSEIEDLSSKGSSYQPYGTSLPDNDTNLEKTDVDGIDLSDFKSESSHLSSFFSQQQPFDAIKELSSYQDGVKDTSSGASGINYQSYGMDIDDGSSLGSKLPDRDMEEPDDIGLSYFQPESFPPSSLTQPSFRRSYGGLEIQQVEQEEATNPFFSFGTGSGAAEGTLGNDAVYNGYEHPQIENEYNQDHNLPTGHFFNLGDIRMFGCNSNCFSCNHV